MNVFFLAAGLGTRLRPLTDKFPKPCVPFLNVPLGYYQFRFLQNLKITGCVANSHHLAGQIERLYKNQGYLNHRILISNEAGSDLLGSAGGLKKASQLFGTDKTILMMNADEVFFTPDQNFLQSALQQHISRNNLATLIVMKHPEAGNKFGAIWCDENNTVKNIMVAKTKPDQKERLTPWHYIGVILLNKRVLPLIPENVETNIFYDILIKELGRDSVEVFKLDCTWFETGNPNDYLSATRTLLSSLDENTLDFINHFDPSHLVQNAGGASLISDSVSISEEKLRGYNVISKTTNRQNLNTLIENSVLFENEILNSGYFT